MSSHDTKGREYARLDQLKAGDLIETDDGFTCLSKNSHIVLSDNHGLYIPCDHGKHYLDGQLDDGDHYIGVYSCD